MIVFITYIKTMDISRMFRGKSPSRFILALVLGAMLAVGGSVWATSVGTNVSVTGTLTTTGATTLNGSSTFGDASGDVNLFTGTLQASTTALFTGAATFYGNVTLGDAAADSLTLNAATGTIASASATSWAIATSSANIPFLRFDTSNYRIGIGTTSPGATFAVGGSGDIYALGALTIDGNTTLGNASADTLTVNAATVTYGNTGTSTIPASSAVSWAIATSSANIPFLRFDTSNTRIGISTTSPGATFSVGGAGNIYALGGLGIGVATGTAGVIENSGNALFGDAAGDIVALNAATVVYNNAGTTTIPSSNANAWAVATSSAAIPLVRYDTSNTRVGISTTTPGATLAVGGSGNIYALGSINTGGGIGAGVATTTAGALQTSGAAQIAGAFNANAAAAFGGATRFGTNGTAVNSIIHGFCDFGPIVASQSIAATTTGTLACTGQAPTGLATDDKIWLTASTTVSGVSTTSGNVIYTGIASSTSATRIQAMVLNLTGVAWAAGTSTWQYLIVK